MSDHLSEDSPWWTEERRAEFVDAAERALATYRRYVDLVASSTSDADRDRIDEALWPAARAFANAGIAEMRFSGTLGPWGPATDPVPEEEYPDIAGEHIVTVLERRDYFLQDADAVRAAIKFNIVVPECPDELPEPWSDTELLGHVLTSVAADGGSSAVEALPGLEFGTGLVVAIAHDGRVAEDYEFQEAFAEGTAFDVDGVLLGVTTIG